MAKKRSNIIFLILGVVIIVGAIVAYRMWNKPNRTVADEKGIQISAVQLVKEFQEDENAANQKYLDKALEVNGVIGSIDKNQEGKMTILLSSDDAMTGVFCTMKEDAGNLATGTNVKIKGFCSGMLSDVRIREAEVMK